ncbi:MAG: cohesin domain-containing protein, partial [bacterium]|nr:cohesin domain-containing protein [bacterium]
MLNKTIYYTMLTIILVCMAATAYPIEIIKQPAGNAGDKNPATFKFTSTNADKQLTKKDGLPISRQDVSSIYNTSGSSTTGDGMRIYDNGIDVCSLEYANLENRKKPVGMDLSDMADWQNITINPGEVGIDPTLGRFKFSAGKAGTVTVIGKYTGSGESYCGVYTNGKYAYLGEGSNGMYVLDISNPQAPKKVGRYELGGIINGLAGDDRYIYLINYRSDLGATSIRIVDVSNPGTPTTAGNFGVSSRVYDIYSVGNYVFVAHISGLRVVDISNPKKPFDRGTYEKTSRNTVYGVYVRGDYAYLAHTSTGLKILDVSDPSNLKEVGQCRLTSYRVGSQPYAVYVSGNYAYLSYGAGGLQIIDVSDPKAPVLAGKYDEGMNDESVYKTYVRGNHAYVISYKKDPKLFNVYVMRVLDISNPTKPWLIQQYTENIGKTIFDSYDISLSKGLAYITDASNVMRILEIPISSELPNGSVTVDYNFTVEPLRIILTSPNGGEVWSGKASNNITWNIIGGVPPYKVTLYYSTNSGKTFDNTIVTDMPMPSFPWTAPGTNTFNLRIKAVVTDANGATANDMSDGDIQIDYIQPLVTKTNIPDKGKDISLDSPLTITFNKPMNQVITQQAINISPNILNKTFGWSEDKKQLTITHSGFNENTTYTCTISTQGMDVSSPGNRLKDTYQWSFRTIVPPPGSISVISNTKNASIYLDGSLVGTGSMIIGDVGVGSHTLSVQKVNYHPWQQVVFVQSKQTVSINATLTPTVETFLSIDTQEEGAVGVGETFTVSIRVEKAAQLTNMDLFINFDPELLDMLEIKDTAFIPKIASKHGTGSISYGAGVMNGSITGNGTIAEIVFMAKNKGEAVLSFDIDERTNRKTSLISGVNELPFMAESKNITIAEFGRVDGYAVIDIPRIGTYSGICVSIPDTELKTITDAVGYFLLKRISPGRINIRANGSGLAPDMWKDIEVVGQQTTTIGTITLINGDMDGDGRVNTIDFSLLREAYFKTKDDAGWLDTGALIRNGYINADLNGDDRVNTEDFAILRDNYFKAAGDREQARLLSAPMLAVEAVDLNMETGDNAANSQRTAHLVIELPPDMDKIRLKAEFPVKIKVENVSSMSSMDFSLAFDPAILSVNRIQGDAFLPKIASDIKNSAGFVSHAAGLMSGSAKGSGTIATVYFVLNKRQNTKIEFICDKQKNRETLLMSTRREVIPWTGEPAILLFDSFSNTSIPAGDSTLITAATATGNTNIPARGQGTVTIGTMTQVASIKPNGMSYGIFLQDNYAYMSCESGGMQIIDVSNPSLPVIAGGYDTAALCRDTYVAGNYAYAADGTGGLVILDVSDTAKPVLVSKIAIDGFCHDVAVSENYAYLAAAQSGLWIVDISKPQTPKKLGKYKTADVARGVCIRDGYVFVAASSKGLQIIDISNPYGPKLAGECDTPMTAYDICLNGKYAYIADYSGGLQIIDVSNPAKPCIVGSYKTNGYAWDVMVKDNLAFVVCESAGLYVVDVANPAHPVLAGKIDTQGKAFGVAAGDGHVFVADDDQGLKVIKAEGIGQTTEDRPQIIADKPQRTEGVDAKITANNSRVKMDDRNSGGSMQVTVEAGSVTAGSRPGTGGAADNIATKTTMVGKPTDMNDRDDGDGQTTDDTRYTTNNTRPSILPIDDYILPDVLLDTWSLSLAVSANNQAGSIRFGMNPYSTDGFDDWVDMPLPPPPSQDKYLQIYFPHPEWGLVFDRFSADIRSMDEDTTQKEWVFEVQTNMPAGTKMSLSLLGDAEDGIQNSEARMQKSEARSQKQESSGQLIGIVPEVAKPAALYPAFFQEIILTDEETGQVWNMNKESMENTITFIADNDGLKRFRLSVKLPVVSKKFSAGWHMVSLPVEVPWFPVE